MKNLKNLFLMSILTVFSFVIVGISNVYAASLITDTDLACIPNTIEDGEQTDCYLVGRITSVSGVLHGVVTKVYTTDHLVLVGTNSYPDKTASIKSDALENSETFQVPGVSTGLACNYTAADLKHNQNSINSYNCVVFYTETGNNAMFSVANSKAIYDTDQNVQNLIKDLGGSNLIIIGSYKLQSDGEVPGSSCGEICVRTWEVPDADGYGNYNDGEHSGNGSFFCEEVHYTPKGDEIPETGAFASYALLVAGALVAISAVAIAKKNNKIYKV